MGAVPRSTKQDNRKPNFRPNRLPDAVAVEISLGDEVLATIAAPQGEKLSESGNVTFSAGISQSAGWVLPGDPESVLSALKFRHAPATIKGTDEQPVIETLGEFVEIPTTGKGVHAAENKAGDKLMRVMHHASLAVPTSDGEPAKYATLIRVDYAVNKGVATLSVGTNPAIEPRQARPVRGVLANSGLTLEG